MACFAPSKPFTATIASASAFVAVAGYDIVGPYYTEVFGYGETEAAARLGAAAPPFGEPAEVRVLRRTERTIVRRKVKLAVYA